MFDFCLLEVENVAPKILIEKKNAVWITAFSLLL